MDFTVERESTGDWQVVAGAIDATSAARFQVHGERRYLTLGSPGRAGLAELPVRLT
jgi:hypothetical protein